MSSDSGDFLDSAEGEVSLFRSIMRTRPVGIHRHVHVLAIHNSIYRDTGHKVPMKDIWAKLGRMYDLDVLEHGVSLSHNFHHSRFTTTHISPFEPCGSQLQEFIGEDPNSGSNSPSPGENLATHPSFREEFNPSTHDESYESYFATRRVRQASGTPTPEPSPVPAPIGAGSAQNSSIRGSEIGKKQRHNEKLKLAGLYDSDSSALTQSGDEAGDGSPPPQGPSGPATEIGTEAGEEEDVEMAERSSPGEFYFPSYRLGSVCCSAYTLCSAPQNLCQLRSPRKPRKLPRKARLRELVRVRPLHPLDPPRNESGRSADRCYDFEPFAAPHPGSTSHGLRFSVLLFLSRFFVGSRFLNGNSIVHIYVSDRGP